jgi:radical SAM protein with 4Fe4S-binding SPASM domain
VERYRYGNLFEQDFEAVTGSSRRNESTELARARMEGYCVSCPYFGACPGSYVADATAEQRRVLASSGCIVREIIDHIIKRLEGTAALRAIEQAMPSQRERPEIAIGA